MALAAAPEISGFRALSPLGYGPTSTIYSAQADGLGRWVALTVYSSSLPNERAQRRFARAFEVARRLGAHPHVVTMLESGFTPESQPYVATEIYERGTLQSRIDARHHMPVDEVLHAGVQLAGALETAHRAEVVHGGIHPARVLLSAEGDPALSDLGLVPLVDRGGLAALVSPMSFHAPPEVLEGLPVTPATDVYALASTLYAALAGRAPYQRGDDDTTAALLVRILHEDVPRLDRIDAPRQLEDVLCGALRSEPKDRPGRMLAFARQLQNCQKDLGLPVSNPVVLDVASSIRLAGSQPPPAGTPPVVEPAPPSSAAPRRVFVPAPEDIPSPSAPTQTPADATQVPSAPPVPPPPAGSSDHASSSGFTPIPGPTSGDSFGPPAAGGHAPASGNGFAPDPIDSFGLPANPGPTGGDSFGLPPATSPADRSDHGSGNGVDPGTRLAPGSHDNLGPAPGDGANPWNSPHRDNGPTDNLGLGTGNGNHAGPAALDSPSPWNSPRRDNGPTDNFGLPGGPGGRNGNGFGTGPGGGNGVAPRNGHGAGVGVGDGGFAGLSGNGHGARVDDGKAESAWGPVSGPGSASTIEPPSAGAVAAVDAPARPSPPPPSTVSWQALPLPGKEVSSPFAGMQRLDLHRDSDEAEDAKPAPATPPGQPLGASRALPVIVLVALVVVLVAGLAWAVTTHDPAERDRAASVDGATIDEDELEGDAGADDELEVGHLDVIAVENPSGVQLDWDGGTDGHQVVVVLSETEVPRLLQAETGTALLVPGDSLTAGSGYCFAVATTADPTPAAAAVASGLPEEALTPAACIRGASPTSVRRG